MNLKLLIDHAVRAALLKAGAGDSPAVVKNSQRLEFGHYQANGVMGAAKPDTGASKRPMNIGMVSNVQGRVCCYGMGGAG